MENKIKGCLFGGALGDSLGYPVEFIRLPSMRNVYNTNLNSEAKLLISDDTQMTMFTLEAMNVLKGLELESLKNVTEITLISYCNWLATQQTLDVPYKTFLMRDKRMFASRAPGASCIEGLLASYYGYPMSFDSKGCGAVMRIAPIGFMIHLSPKEICQYAKANSDLTHTHCMSTYSTMLMALIIYRILNEVESLEESILNALTFVKYECVEQGVISSNKDLLEFVELILKAIDFANSDYEPSFCIKVLGEGWIAEEALAIGIYCALKFQDDFNKAIEVSSLHEGDSDSTASICGQILGAFIGFDNLPQNLVDRIEIKTTMEYMIKDFLNPNDMEIRDYIEIVGE